MLQDEERVSLLSENPLWINDDGECTLIPNTFSEYNAIGVNSAVDGGTQYYKISDEVTIIPNAGMILYSTQEASVKYQTLLQTPEGRMSLLVSSIVNNRNSQSICVSSKIQAESGLYYLDKFDKKVSKKTFEQLGEIRYLNDPNNPICNIKKPHEATGDLAMACEAAFNAIKELCNDEMENLKTVNFRVMFEVFNENGETKISWFPVYYTKHIGDGFLRFSYLAGLPVFINQESAVWFREYWQSGRDLWDLTIGKHIMNFEKSLQIRKHDADVKNAVVETGKFVFNNFDMIKTYGTKIINKIKGKHEEEM